MIKKIARYAILGFQVITFNKKAMQEIADDKWSLILGLIFMTLAISYFSVEVDPSEIIKTLAQNLFSILVFMAAAMLWGGANNLLRFFRVFTFTFLGDLLFAPLVINSNKIVSEITFVIYGIWAIAIYSLIYHATLKISVLKSVLTVLFAIFISYLVIL